jgi:FkbM family methyltransferase
MNHNPCFSAFSRWGGEVEPGFEINFLGVKTREEYRESSKTKQGYVNTEYPVFGDEYFEWIDLLEAVLAAGPEFRMVELGAGYGRWSVNGASAALQLGKTYRITAVEPEPQHFKWLRDNIETNNLDLSRFRLLKAVVTDRDGKSFFLTGQPSKWYGQTIPSLRHLPRQHGKSYREGDSSQKFRPTRKGLLTGAIRITRVDAVSLLSLLQGQGNIDFVDLDVQGTELTLLAAAEEALQKQVKRIHIGTHNLTIETGLRRLFGRLGWLSTYDYPGNTELKTEYGQIEFEDGVQAWINPQLRSVNN